MLDLIRKVRQENYGKEGEVYFSLFDKYITIFIPSDVSVEYAKACASYLNSLDEQVIDRLCEASIRYCNDFLDSLGEELRQFDRVKDVLSSIDPISLDISKPPDGQREPAIHLELNCLWEEEHGMEWIVKGDRVFYVGPFHGINPWSDFETKTHTSNYA